MVKEIQLKKKEGDYPDRTSIRRFGRTYSFLQIRTGRLGIPPWTQSFARDRFRHLVFDQHYVCFFRLQLPSPPRYVRI